LTLHDWIEGVRPTSQELACAVPGAPDGFELLDSDSFGVAGLVALAVAADAGAAKGFELGAALRTDQAVTYASEDLANVALAFRLRMASERDAQDVADLLLQGHFSGSERVLGTTDGREVLILAVSDPDLLLDWPGAETCPAETMPKSRSVAERPLGALSGPASALDLLRRLGAGRAVRPL